MKKRVIGRFNILSKIKKNWLFTIILILILGATYYSYLTEGFVYSLIVTDLDKMSFFITSFGWLAAVIFVLLVILEVVIAPIPPLVLYITGGFLFGTFWGGTLALFGSIIGALLAFGLSQKYGRRIVEKNITKKKLKQFDRLSKKYGAFTIFILRVNPLTSSDIFSYLAGLTAMPLRSFLIGTIFGVAPMVYLQTYVGHDLIKNNPFLSLIFLWIGIAYMLIFLYGIFYTMLDRHKENRNLKH